MLPAGNNPSVIRKSQFEIFFSRFEIFLSFDFLMIVKNVTSIQAYILIKIFMGAKKEEWCVIQLYH